MSTSKETLEIRQAMLDALRAERDLLERELQLQKQVLEQAKGEVNTSRETSSPPRSLLQLSNYTLDRGILAARAIRDGYGDPGHVRDLADAAVFGSSTAAIALAELTLATKTGDPQRQLVEAHAWLSLASMLEPRDKALAERTQVIRRKLSNKGLEDSHHLLQSMARRRSALLNSNGG